MTGFSCVLVGEQSLLVQCADLLARRGHRISAIVSENRNVLRWAGEAGIATAAPGPGLEKRLPEPFDWLFSIANLALLPEAVVGLARQGAINFHDGPLPRYAGLNAPVWALLGGETQYGISWHLVEPGVDTGDLVEQVRFEILPEDTAFSLNARCYASAVDSFSTLVEALERGTLERQAQDLSLRTLCRRDDRPEAAARLDFSRSSQALVRLVRALDHGGYWNPLSLPKIESEAGVHAVTRAEAVQGTGKPGEVISVDGNGLVVACGDGAVRLEGLTCLAGLPVAPERVGRVGDVLPRPDTAALSAAIARVTPGEGHWRRALTEFRPARLPGVKPAGTPEIVSRRLEGVGADRAAAILALFAERIDGAAGLAFADPGVAQSHTMAPGYVANWVPLTAMGESLDAIEGAIRSGIEMARRHPGFARDLIGRDPGLAPMPVPMLGYSTHGAMIDGCVLCVVAQGEDVTLMGDAARLSTAEIDLFAERIGLLCGVEGSAPVETLGLLTGREHALFAALNDTGLEYDRSVTVVGQFEAQVARTPDAPAIVFENRTMRYRELNAQANRVAHVLRGMGVGPDVPAALCLSRGPEMLVGALGILKAGGGYVPVDPAYPADRLALFLADSGAPVIVTRSSLVDVLPPHQAELLVLDTDTRLESAPESNPLGGAEPEDLAYLIYTSGSTGRPKGVMVEHRNLANFLAGMDARIPHKPAGSWLAMTSLSFDISVLELFWTLARGFKVVLTSSEDRLVLSGTRPAVSSAPMDFSLFYWGNDDGPGPRKYELLLESAKFADTHGFEAVWLPERHFHAFGGPYPNPSVLGAAVAAVTRNIGVRSGSVVAPLHHPIRIAEEWAVIDNLTNGRAALGIASGWHPVDFVLRPENAPPDNKAAMLDTIDKVRRLWRGEPVAFDRGGEMVPVQSLPRPVSKELPIWLTIAGNPETWREAGRIGANVLTHLLGQSIEEVGEKIRIYHGALREAGYDPADFRVTLMLHTYVARSRELARETAREPMKKYLLSAAGLVKQFAWSFPAFKRPKGATSAMDIDLGSLSKDEVDGVLDYAFNRYFEDSGLFGTVDDCLSRVEQLKRLGVSEVACLIDYGIAPEQVLEGLFPLAEVLRRANMPSDVPDDDYSIAAQIVRHKVTHLQCTPSMARMLVDDEGARAAMGRIDTLLVGGEALSGELARDLAAIIGKPVLNMYGPTETTIWSTTGLAAGGEGICDIGAPIANTELHVLDDSMQPVPIGATGELWIGGAGVARGYHARKELTSERFVANPFGEGRLYRTGDQVRLALDGSLAFIGRSDHQVKIRGHRIEPGEIEAVLDSRPGIERSLVVARSFAEGDVRLVAYLTGPAAAQSDALREDARALLPAHMVPAHFVALDRFPLTPNGKVDRAALPMPVLRAKESAQARPAAPATQTQGQLAEIWSAILGVDSIRPGDNFFALGGHSLLAIQAHRAIRESLGLPGLSVTDVFRFPVLSALANHIDRRLRSVQIDARADGEKGLDTEEGVSGRLDAMARRRSMRAARQGTPA